jgi:hypothetical protein
MGSLLEKGILKKYLDENCASKPYKICAYKDQLPRSADDFLWDSNSPVHKEGGWAAVKPEYDEIVEGALSDPEYIWMYVKGSVTFTLRQLTVFETGPGNIPFQKGTYVYDGLAQYVPGDLEAFRSSRQYNNTLLPALELPNKVFSWLMLISALSLAVVLARGAKDADSGVQLFGFICICGILLNAWDCATFATINGRYGCRMMWMIPFCLLLAAGRQSGKSAY